MKTREELKSYALSLCVPMLEKAAMHESEQILPDSIDYVGYTSTFLEEFCRPFWGLAPVLNECDDIFLNVQNKKIALNDWLLGVLRRGVIEDGFHRYAAALGGMLDFQNLTELAGLLIGLCFSREKTWDRFPRADQDKIADRIFASCHGQCSHPAGNNHAWFPVFVVLALKKLGYSYPQTEAYIRAGMERIETMYLSDGWYSDGEFGRFDYYEAWSLHAYPLLWCLLEDDPAYEAYRRRYLERTERFLQDYIYFFDDNGAHVPFGRSLSYRFAASCVFPLAVMAGCRINVALAKTVLMKNVSYFAQNTKLDHGVLPPGYLYHAPGLIENYTSDGGSYWCAKAFLALLMPASHPFWQAPEAPLPIEEAHYCMRPANKNIRLAVCGTKHSGVTVYNNVFQYYQNGKYCNPFNDMAAYYNKFAYNSKVGFAVSTRDQTAIDNMISLFTPDGSMRSHRWGFTDLGEQDGIFLSVHTPFANDPATTIVTAMLPLKGSCHVRVHKVTLSRPYGIEEGGFSVPVQSDGFLFTADENEACLRFGTIAGRLKAVGTLPLTFEKVTLVPGHHLLAPQAFCLRWHTPVAEAGVYYFATLCSLEEEPLPPLTLTDTAVTAGEKTIPLSLLDVIK